MAPRESLIPLCDHKSWSKVIHVQQWQKLVDKVTARNRIRLQCLNDSFTGAWLSVCPAETLGLSMSNAEFKVLTRWRLGSEFHTPGEMICQLCGVTTNLYGDHLVCCNQNGMIRRHNAIVETLSKITQCLQCPLLAACQKQPKHLWATWWLATPQQLHHLRRTRVTVRCLNDSFKWSCNVRLHGCYY